MLKKGLLPVCACVIVLWTTAPVWAQGYYNQGEYDPYTVAPPGVIHPAFTTEPRPKLTLDLAGIGLEPITVQKLSLNGQALPGSTWRTRLNVLTLTPDRDLRVGLNRIEVQYAHPINVRHKSNPVSYTFFVNHQPSPPRVTLGSRGELIVNDRPTFVVGGYRSGNRDEFIDALPTARDAGFNMVHDYWFETGTQDPEVYIQQARQYLQRADELGLGVFMGLPRKMVRAFDREGLAQIIAELSGERALWLWYMMDEPMHDSTPVANAALTYHLIKRLDPNHPAVMVFNRPTNMVMFSPFTDIIWCDRYPIIASSDELRSLAPISGTLQYAIEMFGDRKPVWPVLQGHDNRALRSVRESMPDLSFPSDGDHRPNEQELRAQAHLGIAHGAMGVVYYWLQQKGASGYAMADLPEVWASFSRVMHELRELEPILLSTQTTPEFRVEGGNDKVVMWTRALNQRVYVGLVNTSCHQATRLSIRPIRPIDQARQIQGDGQVRIGTEGVEVHLGPAGVGVLMWDMGASEEH